MLRWAALFGWGALIRHALEVTGIRGVTADDLAAARQGGGALKPVISAARDASGVRAFVGPAFLPSSEPLAAIGGALNGIRLDGPYIANLFFSGPGITADALLDEVVQAASSDQKERIVPSAPVTPWLARVTFPGLVPPNAAVEKLVAAAGLTVETIADYKSDRSRWLVIGRHSRHDVSCAVRRLADTHRIDAAVFRRILPVTSDVQDDSPQPEELSTA